MPHRVFPAAAVVAVAAGLSLAGCGGSSTPTPTPTVATIGNNSSAFCTQAGTVAAGFANLGSALAPTSPGAVPSLTTIKQIIAAGAGALDALDSQAPSEIASAFHTFRMAYDQANTAAQSATSVDQLGNVFQAFSAAAVTSASTQITAYLASKCGITPAASTPAPTPT